MNRPLFLAGQTASGKTAVALELAKRVGPVEIVNADAFQIYRGLNKLTAAPSEEELAACPHHLFGLLDPDEECDAATFAEQAKQAITDVGSRALPIVVSGSGLYLKAITHGLAPTPKANPELRAELAPLTLDELVTRYRSLDPDGAETTNLLNRRYVTRNLEISILAGRPASEIKAEWLNNQPDIQAIYLERTREDIYTRINQRTEMMFASGVVNEIAGVGKLSPTAEKTIGLREIQDLIAEKSDRETCIAAIQQATRRYAKRQEMWFRREKAFTRVPVAPEDSAEAIADRVVAAVPLPA